MGLVQLTIQNIVLIDRLTIDFDDGLCALTGETGAGKSILLDSLGLALGARSDSKLVRHGQEKAAVTAQFDVPPAHAIFDTLSENDIEIAKGDAIILRRTLTNDGRSRAYINDQPVSAKLLQSAGEMLIEIHGQFETQGLMDQSRHREILDDYAKIGGELSQLWQVYHQEKQTLERLKAALEKSRTDEDYLRAAIEDLDNLSPQPDEAEGLAALRDRLIHRERVIEALNQAHEHLSADDDPVRSAWGVLDRIADKLPAAADEIVNALSRATAEIEEARAGIQNFSADLQHEEQSLETIDERLFALKAQARKHGCDVNDLLEKREQLAAELNAIEYAEDTLAAQIKAAETAFEAYKTKASIISKQRRAAAKTLDQSIIAELEPLKLGKAKFVTDIQTLPEDQWGAKGMDQVRFLVATNPGAQAGPLNKIASGGEMSRFMLALKVVTAEIGLAETLIFDEVDSGIGGSTADAVGERLAALAKTHQVLVVTHAPQVAARAAHHYIVSKSGDTVVKSDIRYLDKQTDRQEEIARMLAGATITPEARAAAEKLLENAA